MNNLAVNYSNCVKPCSGLVVTGYSKTGKIKNLEDLFPVFEDYNNFKKITQYPKGYDGMSLLYKIVFMQITLNILGYKWKNNLRLVRI